MKIKLWGPLAMALAMATLVPIHARAQQVWADASASYDVNCDCVTGYADYEDDYIAEMYYDLNFSGDMYDSDDSYSEYADVPSDFEADDVTIGDQFTAEAEVSGSIDSEWNFCATGSCGQRCSFRGGCSYCPFSGSCGYCFDECPSSSMPFQLDSEDTSNPTTATCGLGNDLDNLIEEYPSVGITDYTPACNDFVSSVPSSLAPPYSFNYDGQTSDLGLASQGDIEDWARLQGTLIAGLNGLNNNPPLGISQYLATPLTIEAVYRTPYHNCDDVYHLTPSTCGNHAFSRHVYGDAVDIGTAHNEQAWYNLLAWTESQVGYGACIENSTSISNWDHTHVDWKLISPPTRSSCGANEFAAQP